MILADHEVMTPFITQGDDPLNVACDWPHQVAVVMHDESIKPSKLPKCLKKANENEAICKHVEFLRALSKSEVAARSKYNLHYIADSWFTRRNSSAGRDYIDPLLLGGAPYELIATLCGNSMYAEDIPQDLVAMYEQLYFHCRLEDGRTLYSPIRNRMWALNGAASLNTNATEEAKWKAIASTFSYALLVEGWGMWNADFGTPIPDDKYFLMQKRLGQLENAKRLHSGTFDGEQSIDIVTQSMDHEKQQYDMGSGSSENALMDILGTMLELAAPKLAPLPMSETEQKEQGAAVKRKLTAQRKIKSTKVEDAGPVAGRAARDKQIKQHLASEAARQETPEQ